MAKIEYDRHGLPQASGGRKEYKDDAGRVTHVLEWFGYKLHLLVDTRHEVSLAYRISSTKVGDNEALPELVDQGMANLPARRIETLAYDKAADDHKVHEKLDESGIKPVIQNRAVWKDETERMLPGHNGNSNIVYDEAGTLYCYDRTSNPMIRRPMAYIGHEPSRGTLKYRCPARHDGFPLRHVGGLQRGEEVPANDSGQAGDRPAAFSTHPACHETIRAVVQGPHERRADQRAAENILGRRRRQRHRRHAFLRHDRHDDDRPSVFCHALGQRAAARGDVGKDEVQRDREGPSSTDRCPEMPRRSNPKIRCRPYCRPIERSCSAGTLA